MKKLILQTSFCSLCNQVVINKSMACHALSEDRFVQVIKFLRKTLSLFSIFEFCVNKEKKKKHEDTPDRFENGKIHIDIVYIGLPTNFGMDVVVRVV